MNRNKGIWIAVAAGAVIAGVATWLLTTKKGKQLTRRMRGQEEERETGNRVNGQTFARGRADVESY